MLLKFSFHTICASFKKPNVASRIFSKSSTDDNLNSSNLSAVYVVTGSIKSNDGNEISGNLNHKGNEKSGQLNEKSGQLNDKSGQLNEKLGSLNQFGNENSRSENESHSGHARVGSEGIEKSGSENVNHSGHANAERAGNANQAGSVIWGKLNEKLDKLGSEKVNHAGHESSGIDNFGRDASVILGSEGRVSVGRVILGSVILGKEMFRGGSI